MRKTAAFLLLSLALAQPTPAPAAGRLVYNLSVEPATLDPAKATGVKEAHVILNVIQGLTRTDASAKPLPGMAERWDVSPDGKTYTFHLRQARWAHGPAVTAADFVYGWRRILEPANAGEYANQLYLVAGAEAFNKGKTKDFATVGVKATDDRTLVVTLVDPAPFFPVVAAHYAYSPVPEAWDKSHPKWPGEPADYISNGPFRLADWKHRDRLTLKKSPTYHDAAAVTLDEVEMRMVTNSGTALQLWEKGQIDLIEGEVPLPDIDRLKASGKLKVEPYLGCYFACFNNAAKPFDDPRVRKAFSLAVDRARICKSIVRAGQLPAYGFVPPGVDTGAGDFRAAAGDTFREDLVEARRLLADAGYPAGKGFPPVKYLYNDLDQHRTIGEALQSMWRQNLGVKVDLQVKEWKVFIADRQSKNYQIARHGWIGDYPDPGAFLDIFRTGGGTNDAGYANPKFDALTAEARATTDTARRDGLYRQAEKTLLADDMGIAPLYWYTLPSLTADRVSGVVKNPIGYLYFDRAAVR